VSIHQNRVICLSKIGRTAVQEQGTGKLPFDPRSCAAVNSLSSSRLFR
ncbi:hypothetical protein LINPERPRIM_LOCUS5405, partial [Linum perenne]